MRSTPQGACALTCSVVLNAQVFVDHDRVIHAAAAGERRLEPAVLEDIDPAAERTERVLGDLADRCVVWNWRRIRRASNQPVIVRVTGTSDRR